MAEDSSQGVPAERRALRRVLELPRSAGHQCPGGSAPRLCTSRDGRIDLQLAFGSLPEGPADRAVVGGKKTVCRKITGFCGCWYVPQEGNNCKADEVFTEDGSEPGKRSTENPVRGTDGWVHLKWRSHWVVACLEPPTPGRKTPGLFGRSQDWSRSNEHKGCTG